MKLNNGQQIADMRRRVGLHHNQMSDRPHVVSSTFHLTHAQLTVASGLLLLAALAPAVHAVPLPANQVVSVAPDMQSHVHVNASLPLNASSVGAVLGVNASAAPAVLGASATPHASGPIFMARAKFHGFRVPCASDGAIVSGVEPQTSSLRAQALRPTLSSVFGKRAESFLTSAFGPLESQRCFLDSVLSGNIDEDFPRGQELGLVRRPHDLDYPAANQVFAVVDRPDLVRKEYDISCAEQALKNAFIGAIVPNAQPSIRDAFVPVVAVGRDWSVGKIVVVMKRYQPELYPANFGSTPQDAAQRVVLFFDQIIDRVRTLKNTGILHGDIHGGQFVVGLDEHGLLHDVRCTDFDQAQYIPTEDLHKLQIFTNIDEPSELAARHVGLKRSWPVSAFQIDRAGLEGTLRDVHQFLRSVSHWGTYLNTYATPAFQEAFAGLHHMLYHPKTTSDSDFYATLQGYVDTMKRESSPSEDVTPCVYC